MFELTDRDIRRFWAKIHVRGPGQCWEWHARSRHWKGYGLFTLANGKPGGVKHVASRIACFLAHGPAPEDRPHALHACDNTACCNGDHLRWGAQKDNTRDMMERGQYSPPPYNAHYRDRTKAPKGEQNHNAKLTDELVREICRMHMRGNNVSKIADALAVGKYAVADVVRGKSWRHVKGLPSVAELRTGGVRRGFNQFS